MLDTNGKESTIGGQGNIKTTPSSFKVESHFDPNKGAMLAALRVVIGLPREPIILDEQQVQ